MSQRKQIYILLPDGGNTWMTQGGINHIVEFPVLLFSLQKPKNNIFSHKKGSKIMMNESMRSIQLLLLSCFFIL